VGVRDDGKGAVAAHLGSQVGHERGAQGKRAALGETANYRLPVLSHRGDADLPDLTVRVEHLAALAAAAGPMQAAVAQPVRTAHRVSTHRQRPGLAAERR